MTSCSGFSPLSGNQAASLSPLRQAERVRSPHRQYPQAMLILSTIISRRRRRRSEASWAKPCTIMQQIDGWIHVSFEIKLVMVCVLSRVNLQPDPPYRVGMVRRNVIFAPSAVVAPCGRELGPTTYTSIPPPSLSRHEQARQTKPHELAISGCGDTPHPGLQSRPFTIERFNDFCNSTDPFSWTQTTSR